MRPGAPTRLDRTVLALASGTLGHLLGTALEIGPALAGMACARVRARLGRLRPR